MAALAQLLGNDLAAALDPGEAFHSRTFIVGLRSPASLTVEPHLFVTYLSMDHGAHRFFAEIQDTKVPLIERDSVTVDWDFRSDEEMQWTLRKCVGPKFFHQCSLAWQTKKKAKDPSLWPGGILTSPLALGVGIQKMPHPVSLFS